MKNVYYEVEIMKLFIRGYNPVHRFLSEDVARGFFYKIIDAETEAVLYRIEEINSSYFCKYPLDIGGGSKEVNWNGN